MILKVSVAFASARSCETFHQVLVLGARARSEQHTYELSLNLPSKRKSSAG
jgi:hypothetical protein